MIIGFTVENFRSFLTPQSCSFIASADNAHEESHCIHTAFKSLPRLTKTAGVFGPNASGKTNLLLALHTMRELVAHSNTFTASEFASAYTPFAPGDSAHQPTHFRIELLLGGIRHSYAFSYNSQRIVSESLHVHQGRKSQRWFGRRTNSTGTEAWMPFAPRMSGPRDAWRKATHATALFLTVAGQAGAEFIRDIVHWFAHDLVIVPATKSPHPGAFAARLSEPEFKTRVLEVLQAADIQIDDIRAAPVSPSEQSAFPPVPIVHTVEFLHRRRGRTPAWLDFAHEAAGIQRLIHLLGPLLDAIDKGTFLAIDEIDSSLHSFVARFLIQLINSPMISRQPTQLMFNSHSTKLMDLALLRRDEIWLMELDVDHASRLCSLNEQSPRKNERVEKNYLHGKFGAVPVIAPEKWHGVRARRVTRPGPH